MLKRDLVKMIKVMAGKMPVLSITGPRQSGKTTLAKQCFPNYDYMNLENPDVLDDAIADPRYFLTRHKHGLIIDEAQLYPELFSYIQTLSDERGKTGEYILTGSQNFLLSSAISQSLAGRVYITHLLPFSLAELKKTKYWNDDPNEFIFSGFYPRIFDKKIDPAQFYPSYIQTYTERDVRQQLNISNLHAFQKFMRLAAGRTGQLLNYSAIANEMGLDVKTIKSWFSVLEASFIVYFLQPHFTNFNKRLVKTPKLYFYDTGLACSLLGIKDKSDLDNHWAKGALFENLVITDLLKNYLNKGQRSPLYFWRDNTGHEVDCLIDDGMQIKPVEIKSSATMHPDFLKGITWYNDLRKDHAQRSFLFYGGPANSRRGNTSVLSWKNTEDVLKKS